MLRKLEYNFDEVQGENLFLFGQLLGFCIWKAMYSVFDRVPLKNMPTKICGFI